MTVEADLILIQRLADAADDAARAHFRQQLAIEDKPDLSPVTAADRAAEAAMRRMLEADRPTDAVLGEEYGLSPGGSGRLWVLDPIDGTRAFVAGRPLWGVLIGLLDEGRPRIGLISAAAVGDRWIGRMDGAPATTLNGRPAATRPCARLADARAASTHPGSFTAQGHAAFQRVGRSVRDMLFGGDCHNYGLLASGFLDLVMEEGLKPHDWAALVPVVAGAGGIITDWRGRPLTLGGEGRVLATGDPRVHAEVLARL